MTKFCPECGTKQRDDNTHFCSNCGFDFSQIDNRNADSIIVPIDSNEGSTVSKPNAFDNSSQNNSSVSKANRPNSQAYSNVNNQNNSSSTNRTSYSNSRNNANNGSDGFLSNLSFNKCFLAFAILFILLFLIGFIGNATQTEPTSDNGLTSFMDSSGNYVMSSIMEELNDNRSSNDDSIYNYLSYDSDSS